MYATDNFNVDPRCNETFGHFYHKLDVTHFLPGSLCIFIQWSRGDLENSHQLRKIPKGFGGWCEWHFLTKMLPKSYFPAQFLPKSQWNCSKCKFSSITPSVAPPYFGGSDLVTVKNRRDTQTMGSFYGWPTIVICSLVCGLRFRLQPHFMHSGDVTTYEFFPNKIVLKLKSS